MDNNKQENEDIDQANVNTNKRPDLYRICPSQLTKHELEDLYFTVLDTNIQLRRTIQGQEDKIKQLSTKLHRKVAAQKVLQAEEFKDCCVITKTKLRQQKESLAQLRRAHDKTAERIRKINMKLSSEKSPQPSLLKCTRCEPETSNFSRYLKTSPSFLNRQRQAHSNPRTPTPSANLRNRVIIMNSVATQTEIPRYYLNTKSLETQTDSTVRSNEIESSETQNESLTDKDTDTSIVSQKESFKNNTKNVTTQTESSHYENNSGALKNIKGKNVGSARTTQTETNSDKDNNIGNARTTQTETNSDKNNVVTKSIQTQTDPITDSSSVEQQDELASKNYKLSNLNNNQNNLCDENKCRTHINELNQKVFKLVAELDNTHYMYSTRIGRLEVELQEHRNTNVREQHQYENYMNQLVNNLKEAHVLSAELKEQLAVEKRKVAELIDLMRTIKMNNRVTRTIPQPLVNIDSQNYKNVIKQESVSCTCCSESNVAIDSNKWPRNIANKKQNLIDSKKETELSNSVTQQDTSKTETVENLAEIGTIQDTKADGNIPNFTTPKSATEGSKIFRNIYWNSKTRHISDAFPTKNEGIANISPEVRNSNERIQNKYESSLETTKKNFEDSKKNKPDDSNIINISDAIASEDLRDRNSFTDKHNKEDIQNVSELSQVQDIAVSSGSRGGTEAAKNRNSSESKTEYNRDIKYSSSMKRISGDKAKKDFDPNILAASLAGIAEKQMKTAGKALGHDDLNPMEAKANLVRQESELSVLKIERASLPHITEVIFKDSKVEFPVSDSAKPFEGEPWSDQQATTLNQKLQAPSKTTEDIETKPTKSVIREKRYSQQLPSPTPTLVSDDINRKTDLLNDENTYTKDIADEIRANSKEKRWKENIKTKEIPGEIRITSEEKRRRESIKTKDLPAELSINSEDKKRRDNIKTKDIPDEIRTNSEEKRRKQNTKSKDVLDEIRINSEEKRWRENTTGIADDPMINSEKIEQNYNMKTKDVQGEIRIDSSKEKRYSENTETNSVNTKEMRQKDNTKTNDISDDVRINSEEKRRKDIVKSKSIAEVSRMNREEIEQSDNTKTKNTSDEMGKNSEENRRKDILKSKGIAELSRKNREEIDQNDNIKIRSISDEIGTNSVEIRREDFMKTKGTDKTRSNKEEIEHSDNKKAKHVSDEIRINSEEKRRKDMKTKGVTDELTMNREEIKQSDNTKTKDMTGDKVTHREQTIQKEVFKIGKSPTSTKINKYTSKNDQNLANKSKNDNRTSSASQTERVTSWVIDSMDNYYYSQSEGLNALKTFIKRESEAEVVPEKLGIQKDKNSDVPIKTQREISMYRRNSGTLCFTTSPGADRLHCECGKKTLCGGLINKDTLSKYQLRDITKYEQGTCTRGCEICTRATSPVNMGDQVLTSIVKQDNEYDNYSPNEEEVTTSRVKSISNDNSDKPVEETSNEERRTTKRVEDTLCNITEELEHCKLLLQMKPNSSPTASEVPKSTKSYNLASKKVPNDFDTGCQYALKRGVAKHSISEEYSSKCVFVLHIGTVVLSDEAVLNYRNKSLVLTWKFYDQNVSMTQMTAGRVVLFDFSTEYEIKMTDDFLSYMKHGELRILICEVNKPDQPIASCKLPLRDALLNTNRRADMSLALIAEPETIYDWAANKRMSDPLDSRDEIGVLDLWCMLHADANLTPGINRAIAQQSKFLADQTTDTLDSKNVLQQVTDDKSTLNDSQDINMSFSNTYNKPSPNTDEKPCLHRWGSSVLRLPSREASEQITEEDLNATPESLSIKGKYDGTYKTETKRNDGDVLQLSDRIVFDDNVFKTKRKSPQGQEVKPRNRKQDAAPTESMQYDPNNYPSSGRNSGVRSTRDNMLSSNDKNVGPEEMDTGFTIISEVTANIKSSDDMKRVMNRSSLPVRSRVSKAETSVQQNAFLESQKVGASTTAAQEMARLKKARQKRQSLKEAAEKKRNQETDFLTMRPDSVILPKEPSDTSNINKKYDNIAKTFIRTEDPFKKQVTIKANHGNITDDTPQRDQDSNEEVRQSVDITILWLALNEECEAMLNPRVQRVYVAYEFLGRSGADMETPVSLPKPKHYVEKCYYNFKKTFILDKEDIPLLTHMIRCRAASNIPRSNKDCIVFTVISEPPEDPLGLEICEDIGYANLFLGDLLAYSAGSPGYTEVIPVRSRYGTSVCGVLAVRLDGLDVLRQYLSVGNSQIFLPQID